MQLEKREWILGANKWTAKNDTSMYLCDVLSPAILYHVLRASVKGMMPDAKVIRAHFPASKLTSDTLRKVLAASSAAGKTLRFKDSTVMNVETLADAEKIARGKIESECIILRCADRLTAEEKERIRSISNNNEIFVFQDDEIAAP